MGLEGQSILVVEDDVLIASYLVEVVEDAGAVVIGPAEDNRQALELLARGHLSAAILDVALRDGDVTPLALELAARGIPFVVHTGAHVPLRLRTVFGDAPVLNTVAPARRIVDALAQAIARPAALTTRSGLKRASLGHVLLIEDEADTAIILEGHMRALGCDSVEQADTEIGAILAATHRRPDLMVADINLREGNGLAAALTINATYGVPLIVVTAHPPKAAAIDPDLVVGKPFDAAVLKAAVARAIGRRPMKSGTAGFH